MKKDTLSARTPVWNALRTAIATAVVSLVGISGAHATAITCGNMTLGVRTTTVDPALSCLYAGLQNPGDPALVTLVNSLISPDTSTLVERDAANSNGGLLDITGVGGQTGGWDFDPSVWGAYGRVFLYFHFGDAQDDPSTTSPTDPDTFIVELKSPDATGTWSFGGTGAKLTGLSNIGLLGAGDPPSTCPPGTTGSPPDCRETPDSVPEPGVLFLIGAGLLGLGMMRRRVSR
jgi:hypothetical protein